MWPVERARFLKCVTRAGGRICRSSQVVNQHCGMEYGILTNPTRDNDVYTRTVYSPTSGLVSQRWRDVNGNGTQDTGDAVTTYSYGTTRGTLGPASLVATGHLVSAIERPLQTAGETAADRKTSLAYNALGEQVWSQDSMGTVRDGGERGDCEPGAEHL